MHFLQQPITYKRKMRLDIDAGILELVVTLQCKIVVIDYYKFENNVKLSLHSNNYYE